MIKGRKCKCLLTISSLLSYVMRSERSGLGLAPFDPDHNSTALLVDEDLYAGTVADLSGVDPIIFRLGTYHYKMITG